jgi:hypothetical protein
MNIFRRHIKNYDIQVPEIWWMEATGSCCFKICEGRYGRGRCMYVHSGFEGEPDFRTIRSIFKLRFC